MLFSCNLIGRCFDFGETEKSNEFTSFLSLFLLWQECSLQMSYVIPLFFERTFWVWLAFFPFYLFVFWKTGYPRLLSFYCRVTFSKKPRVTCSQKQRRLFSQTFVKERVQNCLSCDRKKEWLHILIKSKFPGQVLCSYQRM